MNLYYIDFRILDDSMDPSHQISPKYDPEFIHQQIYSSLYPQLLILFNCSIKVIKVGCIQSFYDRLILRKMLLLVFRIRDEIFTQKHLARDQILQNQSFLSHCTKIDFLETLLSLFKLLIDQCGFAFLEEEVILENFDNIERDVNTIIWFLCVQQSLDLIVFVINQLDRNFHVVNHIENLFLSLISQSFSSLKLIELVYEWSHEVILFARDRPTCLTLFSCPYKNCFRLPDHLPQGFARPSVACIYLFKRFENKCQNIQVKFKSLLVPFFYFLLMKGFNKLEELGENMAQRKVRIEFVINYYAIPLLL